MQHGLWNGGRRGIAAGAAILIFVLSLLAVSPSLHERLHDGMDSTTGPDHCAVALLTTGICVAVPVMAPAPHVASWSELTPAVGTQVSPGAPALPAPAGTRTSAGLSHSRRPGSPVARYPSAGIASGGFNTPVRGALRRWRSRAILPSVYEIPHPSPFPSSLVRPAAQLPATETDVQQLQAQIRELQATMEKTRREQEQQIAELNRKLAALVAASPLADSTVAPTPYSTRRAKAARTATGCGTRVPCWRHAAGRRTGPNVGRGVPGHPRRIELHEPQLRGDDRAPDRPRKPILPRRSSWATTIRPSAAFPCAMRDRNRWRAVDPYFKGFANIVLKLDKNNETEIELEESFLQSTSLPANLQLKAGQYFASFGRQNPQHPHTGSSLTSRSSSGAPSARTACAAWEPSSPGSRRRPSTPRPSSA